MRIAVITPQRVFDIGAGDWIQAKHTALSLRSLDNEVEHFILGDFPSGKAAPEGTRSVPGDGLPRDFHVWHFITTNTLPTGFLRSLFHLSPRPLMAASTVYWDSALHRRVIMGNGGSPLLLLKYGGKVLCAGLHPGRDRFRYFDLLLPNSFSEVEIIRRFFALSPHGRIGIVPNGISLPDGRGYPTLPLPEGEEGEFLLYPGFFAPRKNQLGFIRAMKGSSLPVAFMGGALPTRESQRYFQRCREEAGDEFRFLGHLEHGSRRHYAALQGARIVCLASSCETPGLAALEGAAAGARPVLTREGSTREYFGLVAEYFNPLDRSGMRDAIATAWERGRLSEEERDLVRRYSWDNAARSTLFHYRRALGERGFEDRGIENMG